MNPLSQYLVIDDFFTQEHSEWLCNHIIENNGEDRRPLYEFFQMTGSDFLKSGKQWEWDPDKDIYRAVEYAFNYFKDNFEMEGRFELNRLHGNTMHTGAELSTHTDEDPAVDGTYNQYQKSYILTIALNDDFEGGEYLFPDQESIFKPKQGSLTLFPGFCTPHGVAPVTKGSRVNIIVVFHDILNEEKHHSSSM
jgi:hypothetical protein